MHTIYHTKNKEDYWATISSVIGSVDNFLVRNMIENRPGVGDKNNIDYIASMAVGSIMYSNQRDLAIARIYLAELAKAGALQVTKDDHVTLTEMGETLLISELHKLSGSSTA